jgi:tryptophan halogenase
MSGIGSVLVVGGGSAGWIVAAMLAKHLNALSPTGVQIRLLESPDIPIIGVGEGTFPTMRDTLRSLGVSESDFMRSCSATFKQAIKFVDWEVQPGESGQSHYYHLFTPPRYPSGIDLTPYWLMDNQNSHYANRVSFQAAICDAGLGPKKITTPEYDYLANYAYHLDAVKFADFLRLHATGQLGVKNIKGTVTQVNLRDDGAIASLVTAEHETLSADLYIDCSGFHSLLLGGALKVPFIDKKDILFVDNAVTIQVPYVDENDPIPPYTISTAHEAGWTWDIGLHSRRGIGYVYSSAHTTHDQAEKLLRNYVGDVADDIATRRIPMKVGYREKFWEKNCIAIGLASGFLEPLESTALVMVEAAAQMLVDIFPREQASIPYAAKKFNDAFRYRWERIIDFVKLHYCITRRDDNQFWLDNKENKSIPDSLLEKLNCWKMQPPTNHDFPSTYETFNLGSYQYILYGMNFPTQVKNDRGINNRLALALEEFASNSSKSERLMDVLPAHRALIEKVYQYGFQVI